MANDVGYDELLKKLPVNARPIAAECRNARIRMQENYRLGDKESEVVTTLLRRLVLRYGVSQELAGRLVGLSRTRVKQRVKGE